LAYADDTIISTSAVKTTLDLIMFTLGEYEKQSGQLINKSKSSFYVYRNTTHNLVHQAEEITCYYKGKFPFTYFRCPLFHSKKRNFFYNDLIKKIRKKLQAWKGEILSFGVYCKASQYIYYQLLILQSVSSMISTSFLLNSYGTVVMRVEEDIGFHGLTFVCLKMREVYDLDPCLIFQKCCLLSYGGFLGQRSHFGLTLCEINIVKKLFLKRGSGEGAHNYGSTCLKLGILLIRKSGGK
ncbi:hypothetical protein H5410_031230, partial [Solanum commersonii]